MYIFKRLLRCHYYRGTRLYTCMYYQTCIWISLSTRNKRINTKAYKSLQKCSFFLFLSLLGIPAGSCVEGFIIKALGCEWANTGTGMFIPPLVGWTVNSFLLIQAAAPARLLQILLSCQITVVWLDTAAALACKVVVQFNPLLSLKVKVVCSRKWISSTHHLQTQA